MWNELKRRFKNKKNSLNQATVFLSKKTIRFKLYTVKDDVFAQFTTRWIALTTKMETLFTAIDIIRCSIKLGGTLSKLYLIINGHKNHCGPNLNQKVFMLITAQAAMSILC